MSGDERDPRRQGGWLPQRQNLESWLKQLRERAEKKAMNRCTLPPSGGSRRRDVGASD